MDQLARMRIHERAALREEDAAVRAAMPEHARLHSALANMHRHEAARMDALRRSLKIAFAE